MEKRRADTSVKAVKHILEEETLQLEEIRAKLESNPNMDDATEDQLLNQHSYQENAVNEAQADYEAKLAEQCKILQLDGTLKTRLKNRKNVTNLSNVNQRARKANEKAAFMPYKQKIVKEEKVAANGVTLDFYARRKVKPKNLWDVGQTKTEDGDDTTTTKENENKSSRVLSKSEEDKIIDGSAKTSKSSSLLSDKESSSLNNKATPDIAHQSHQFAIDEDFLGKNSINPYSLNSHKATMLKTT